MTRRFVLLDRDGTLNEERHYLSDPDDMALIPGVAEGLRRLRDLGLGLVVVTNQAGIAYGYFDEARLDAIHDRLRALLAAEGVTLEGIYHCPHGPNDGCACRKPRPGLALAAAREHGFDPARSFMVGDKAADMGVAAALGIPGILVRTGHGAETAAQPDRGGADVVVNDLRGAVREIEQRLKGRG